MKALFTILLMFALAMNAQPPWIKEGRGKPECIPPPCVPIDGGLWLLLAAALLLGAYKLKEI